MRKHMRHFAGNGRCWLLAVLLAFVLPVPDSAAEGFYVGLEAGFSKSGDLDVSQSLIDHPTRCDSFLYPSGVAPPMDAECTTDRITTIANVFAPGAGFAGGATLGYALGNGLRFEAEYLNRRQGSQRKLARLGPGGGETFDQKQSEWDENDPPSERVYDLRAHHFFLNVYYDLRNDSPFTPYIGAGAGLGSTEMRYSARFLRGGALGTEPWQVAVAGTVSDIDTELGKTRFGFQVAGGVDYALGDNLSAGAKVRWTRLGGFDRDDVSWTRVRGHESIRTDGVTPLTADFEVDDTDIWTFTVGLKYYP